MGIKDLWQAGQVALSANRLADRAFYEQVAEEMRQGIRDEALWLMAYERAAGDETSSRVQYIGLRVQALKDAAVIAEATARGSNDSQSQPIPDSNRPRPEGLQNKTETAGAIEAVIVTLVLVVSLMVFVAAFATP